MGFVFIWICLIASHTEHLPINFYFLPMFAEDHTRQQSDDEFGCRVLWVGPEFFKKMREAMMCEELPAMRRDRRCQEPLRSRTCEQWVGNGTGDAEPQSEGCKAASRQLGGQGAREVHQEGDRPYLTAQGEGEATEAWY